MALNTMKTILVDFSTRTLSGLINLETLGARESIKKVGGINIGETVLLTDDTLSVKALVIRANSILFGKPYWDTMKIRLNVPVEGEIMDKERIMKLAKMEMRISNICNAIYKDLKKELEEKNPTWLDLLHMLHNHQFDTAGGFARYIENHLKTHNVWDPHIKIEESRTKEAIFWLWQSYVYLGKAMRVLTNWFPKENK